MIKILEDIFLSDVCPMCKDSLYTVGNGSKNTFFCIKGCFSKVGDVVWFFDRPIDLLKSNVSERIENQIKYWKENDRYLMEFLTRDDD